MARHHDLPGWLAAVHPRTGFRTAETALAVVVSIVVATADVHGVIGFSSFGVLIYYAIANAAAFTQPHEQRRWPHRVNHHPHKDANERSMLSSSPSKIHEPPVTGVSPRPTDQRQRQKLRNTRARSGAVGDAGSHR